MIAAQLAKYHKALADVLHLAEVDLENFEEGSADRCSVEDAWEVLNTRGDVK